MSTRRYQPAQEERIQPKHGEEVDINGTPCLWLDSGTRKGVWLSPKAGTCVLANADKIRIFLAKHEARKPSAEADADKAQLEANNAAMRRELDELKSTLAQRTAKPTNVMTEVERFNPVA